jgi:hypothetical protein
VSAPRRPPRPDPHSQAVGWLHGHWLLGPVLQHLRIYPVPERLRGEIPPGAWCVLEGSDTIYFDADLRLNAPQWAGVLSLAVLMQALDAPAPAGPARPGVGHGCATGGPALVAHAEDR